MSADELLKYKIAISLIPGIGSVLAKNIISYCGGVEAVFLEKKGKLLKIPGIGEKAAESISNFEEMQRAEEEVEFIKEHKIRPLFYTDEDYPQRLKNCNDSPVMLYYQGNCDLNQHKVIGIVGTRSCTGYGRMMTEELVAGLMPLGCLIVSGLAYGIDICAHKNALKQQLPTVGVMGHGLDRVYPGQHKSTAARMVENGGLLTEFISQTIPDRENFPKRNRIVAGMCDALVVVETASAGGAMITAGLAGSYNRDVFAYPGRSFDAFSAGCNYLIKTNRAGLIENSADLIQSMGWVEHKGTRNLQPALLPELTTTEQELIDVIGSREKISIDELCSGLNYTHGEVALLLLDMEFKGCIRSLPGKFYCLN
jgi:DNA processing protein